MLKNLAFPPHYAIVIHPPNKTLAQGLATGAFPSAAPITPIKNRDKEANVITAEDLHSFCFIKPAASNSTEPPTKYVTDDATATRAGLGTGPFCPPLPILMFLFAWNFNISYWV